MNHNPMCFCGHARSQHGSAADEGGARCRGCQPCGEFREKQFPATPQAGTSAGRVGTDIAAPTGSTPVKAPAHAPAACHRCGSTEPKIRGAEDLGEKGRPRFYPCNNDAFPTHPAAASAEREAQIRAEVIEEAARYAAAYVVSRTVVFPQSGAIVAEAVRLTALHFSARATKEL